MKALIAMSGGVDSSVAAFLMKKEGHECIGCTMKLYANEDIGISRAHTCCSLDDVEDARSVAYKLEMPYYVFNFSDLFREKVIRNFTDSYEQGRTPNPCIECNRHMKFDKLFERAVILNCDKVVTGHYVRIEETPQGPILCKAVDDTKDQSYVLYAMTVDQLRHSAFPLGNMRKEETRRLAQEAGFINAAKPDSQDICFVPDGDYAAAIACFTGKEYPVGEFVDKTGKVLGTHRGIVHYTIGQRKGLGIAMGEPVFVCDIQPESNRVVLGRQEDLMSRTVYTEAPHFINREWMSARGLDPAQGIRCSAKLRYRHREQPCVLRLLPEGGAVLTFDEPQRAATPGQAAVFYAGDAVLGGAVICGRE